MKCSCSLCLAAVEAIITLLAVERSKTLFKCVFHHIKSVSSMMFKCRFLVKESKLKLLVFVPEKFECLFQLVSVQESAPRFGDFCTFLAK